MVVRSLSTSGNYFRFILARIRQPQDGLFSGQVDAVNTQDNTYRITFDREGNNEGWLKIVSVYLKNHCSKSVCTVMMTNDFDR